MYHRKSEAPYRRIGRPGSFAVPRAGAHEDAPEQFHITTSPEFLSPGVIHKARSAFARSSRSGEVCLLLEDTRGTREKLSQNPALLENCASRVRLMSPNCLKRLLVRRASIALTAAGAGHLRTRYPGMSAAAPRRIKVAVFILLVTLLMTGFVLSEPDGSLILLALPLSIPFQLVFFLRFSALIQLLRESGGNSSDAPVYRGDDCPVYSILIPLYKETAAVPGLVAALRALDYPPEKLEIFFLTEAGDRETRRALDQAGGADLGIIMETNGPGPRTKPRALQTALPLTTGRFITVYDAEDRPDPLQLRKAVAAFGEEHSGVGCLQAKLKIRNRDRNWLTAHFGLEYDALFEGVLPYLAGLGIPLPLGGTSNHFRREALDGCGGWDPHNVTEDADLGLRLARFGWSSSVLDSVTYEEAPETLRVWRNQRSRWFKGWIQTLEVHTRDPLRLFGGLGAAKAVLALSATGAQVLSALIHPVILLWLIWQTADMLFSGAAPSAAEFAVLAFVMTNTALAYLSTVLLYVTVSGRRPISMTELKLFAGLPVYWLLQSLAAARAVFQFFAVPFEWEKTPHGLSEICNRFDREAMEAPGVKGGPVFKPRVVSIAAADQYPEARQEASEDFQVSLRRIAS